GLLTGKFGREHKFEEGDHRKANKLFNGENYERAQQALDKLRPNAERHQCSLAQLALAWLTAQPQTNAIAGARNSEQAVSNAQAAEVELSADEVQEIDAIGRTVSDRLDDNPVMWDWDSTK
ncbi:MAG: aldo/keto reductase, partial [Microcoleus sp. SIO2G3]|nr:aldo/keto reductase [Microcoleus sp. SIO2G3]